MRRIAWLFAVPFLAAGALAAATLFNTPTESKWSVKSGDAAVGTIVVISDGTHARAEWQPVDRTPQVTVIATDKKLWVSSAGGDVELASFKGGIEKTILPAFALPVTSSSADKVAMKNGKVDTYSYGTTTATYEHDAKGTLKVVIKSGSRSWTATRTSSSKPQLHATLFEVKPKRAATSRMARLAGDLLGPSDSSVSATAGGRGVDKGTKFKDGGDYDALEKLEARDEKWDESLAKALSEFQKEGKVGEAKEQRR
jgi:hypothetical protein